MIVAHEEGSRVTSAVEGRVVLGGHAGIVWVNTCRAVSSIAPFGGCGLSGYGREGAFGSIFDCTRSKSVWLRALDDPTPYLFVMR